MSHLTCGGETGLGTLKTKPAVFVSAFWAFAQLCATRGGIERIASYTVENRLASLAFESPMVAAIIVEPQSQKNCSDERAVDHDGRGEFEHHRNLADCTLAAKRCP
jgi:hypothetical protein